MKKILSLLVLAVASMSSAMAAETPVYVGGEVGYAHLQHDDAKQNGASGNAFVGYQFTKNFGAELGYTRLSTVSEAGYSAKPEMFTLEGVGKMNVINEKTAVFAKGGLAYTRVRGDVSNSHYVPVIGVGAEYALNKNVSAIAEVKYVHNFADADVTAVNTSVGLKYQF
jgi:OOP family OmpA-OmpF porin